MKNYCLVIICINKPFNCVIRLITIMIHNIRCNNSTIFNTDNSGDTWFVGLRIGWTFLSLWDKKQQDKI